jgi:Thiamine pyrophosphate enzyme, N-terminal TPP binding domain
MQHHVRGADLVARTLEMAGTRTLFTLSGNHIMPLFDALFDSGVALVHVRHEAAAVRMADGWGRLTGRCGVACVSGGAGFCQCRSRAVHGAGRRVARYLVTRPLSARSQAVSRRASTSWSNASRPRASTVVRSRRATRTRDEAAQCARTMCPHNEGRRETGKIGRSDAVAPGRSLHAQLSARSGIDPAFWY